MISAKSFISGSLDTVDAVIGNFVTNAYNNFIEANSNTITILFTIYVMILGFQYLFHTKSLGLSSLIRHLIIMLCVYGMVMKWQLYHLLVYNIFTNEPGHIAQILISSINHSGMTIATALDQIYEAVINASIAFFGQINFSTSGLAFIFYGILVFLIGTIMCIFALLLFIYAKMMMAVGLALGPLFIIFIMWEPTKGLFSAWLNKLITTALIPVVTSAILVLMLSIIDVTLPKINQPIEQLQFYGIAPFLGLNLATTLILAQVFRICSSLGGGITLSSLSKAVDIAQFTYQRSGLNQATQFSKDWVQSKARQIKKSTRGKNG